MAKVLDYATPGPFTDLDGVSPLVLESFATDPVEICSPVHELVIQPTDTQALNLSAGRFDENQIRPAGELVRRLLALDPAPPATGREPGKRVVGTCRHFAVPSCALLRHRGIAARVRCGFATYFQPGQRLGHWITEYWDDDGSRWVRLDSEILGRTVLPHPHDLRPGEFLSGGEAWSGPDDRCLRREDRRGLRRASRRTHPRVPEGLIGQAAR
ncbi:transglutaminase-like domain-containing protein [Amycolatopsis speibonae]|uniref:Transglutaminase-like domain-containing protein n=1 Tax=Amycolatopsis speibonae TaxID=1450224 RepID=A0ABV7P2F3_9PSEU